MTRLFSQVTQFSQSVSQSKRHSVIQSFIQSSVNQSSQLVRQSVNQAGSESIKQFSQLYFNLIRSFRKSTSIPVLRQLGIV